MPNKYIYCDCCNEKFTPAKAKKELARNKDGLLLCRTCQESDEETLPPKGLMAKPEQTLLHPDEDAVRQTVRRMKANPHQAFLAKNVPPPIIIKSMLDLFIVGQDAAKKAIATTVYNQQMSGRAKLTRGKESIFEKTNILIIGPTGCGKTAMLKRLAKIAHVPMVIEDATSFSSTGYVGRDVEMMVRDLLKQSPKDRTSALNGIIFIDEIDKLARRETSANTTADPSHGDLQHGLLKMLEGSTVEICLTGERHNPIMPCIQVDTSNILFIAGGAFAGLEDIVRERLKKTERTRSIGFGSSQQEQKTYTNAELRAMATVEDLQAYGLSAEFLGRFQLITKFDELDEAALVRILTEPENALTKQYQEAFGWSGVDLQFTDEALRAIARQAIKRGTGARALRSIMEETLGGAMFNLPGTSFKTALVTTDETGELQVKHLRHKYKPQNSKAC